MAMTVNFASPPGAMTIAVVNGLASTDATPIPSQSGTATASNATITGIADTSALLPADHVQVVIASQKFMNGLAQISVNTNVKLFTSNHVTASEAVTVTRMKDLRFYFDMPFTARTVEWNDETNRVTWTWRPGLPLNMAYKRVWATGVQTLVNAGIFMFNNRLCVGPDVAPVSSMFSFQLEA